MISNNQEIFSSVELNGLSKYVLNAINAHVAILNKEGIVVAYNKKWKSCRNSLSEKWYRPELNESLLKILQPPLAEGSDFALKTLIGCKSVLSGERDCFESNYSITQKEKKSWFKITITSLEDDKGALVIHEDISNKVKSQQYIRETQQKFEHFFENSLYGIIITDQNNQIIEINKTAARLLNSTVDELLFENIPRFLNLETDIQKLQKQVNQKGNYVGERKLQAIDGSVLPVEMHVNLFRNEKGQTVTSWAFKDISGLKRSEQALKISDQRYRLQFENSQEGIMLALPDGTIFDVNPAACEILGYTAEEIINKHRSLFLDETNPKNKKALDLRDKGGFLSGEFEFKHKNGHRISVELNSSSFTLENGEKRSIVNFRDITSRKRIQEQLQQEKVFTESVISSLPNTFFVIDENGGFIRWNSMLEQDFGYSTEEVQSLDIFDLIHPDDHETVRDVLETNHKGQAVSLELRCLAKNGRVLHYHVSAKGFDQNGKHFTVGGGINLNDLKEIEQEKRRNSELLRQLFYNSPIGIVLIDNESHVINSNKSFESIFGYSSSELKGQKLDEIIVPASCNCEAKTLSQNGFTGDSFQTEATRIRKDGKKIPVLIGGVPVEIDGEVIAVYGMYVDISERKQLENQIVNLLERETKARRLMEDIFEEAPSAIAMLEGENHTFTYANEEYKQLVGQDNLVGQTVAEALPEVVKQGYLDVLNECYATGKTKYFSERALELEGFSHPKYLNIVYKPLFNDKHEVYGISAHVVNVTEQVEARTIIEASLAEKETLLNEVHHRVKNNLAIVSGLIALEMMDSTDENVNKHLQSTNSRITTIANIHEMLYQNESLSHVSFSDYLHKMLPKENKTSNKGAILFSEIELDEIQLNINQAIPAGILLNELMSQLKELLNLQGTDKFELTLSLKENDGNVRIEMIDLQKNLLQHYKHLDQKQDALREELIQVLLKQIHGKMSIKLNSVHSLLIHFDKAEFKGAHSTLIT